MLVCTHWGSIPTGMEQFPSFLSGHGLSFTLGETRASPWGSVPLFPPPQYSFRGKWELEWKEDTRDRYSQSSESFLQLSRTWGQQFGNVLPFYLLSPVSPFRGGSSGQSFLAVKNFALSEWICWFSHINDCKRKILHSLITSAPSLSYSSLRFSV